MSEAEEEGFRRMLESFLRGDNPTWSPRSEEEEECCCAIQWQDDVPLWDESGSEAGAASNGPEASASPASPATPPATPANDVTPPEPRSPPGPHHSTSGSEHEIKKKKDVISMSVCHE